MKKIVLMARIVEMMILAPILFLILSNMGDYLIVGFVAILLSFYVSEWVRKRIVIKLTQSKKKEREGVMKGS